MQIVSGPRRRLCLPICLGLFCGIPRAAAEDLSEMIAGAWNVAEQRCEANVSWMTAGIGAPQMFSIYPGIGDAANGHWILNYNIRNWRNGFWPGTLWFLAQRTGSDVWRQRATDWSAPLANTDNTDHDIGFITLASLGKGWLYHDDLTDPGGVYRAFAKTAITTAATKLDSRFNQPNTSGVPIPANFIRSWNTPFQDPYPVCIDNLMNLEVLFLAYEMNGRQPTQRPWYDHALTHARTTIARLLRADGSTYHVVKHFENGPQIGQIERKCTVQGYGDETTWSRGQAWAIHGFTSIYRYARRDPGTNAADILAAAQSAADYFISHLPNDFTDDPYNHRVGDFVPPCDFDVALGEPVGPWNDGNNDYNPATGSGLGDRRSALLSFTLRDSAAAAIAASGLIELSGQVASPTDQGRYLGAAEKILKCLITYDSEDPGSAPDYLCAVGDTTNPGILKAGCVLWGDFNRSQIYGDYYFLEALSRYEALTARKKLEKNQQVRRDGANVTFEFETTAAAPTLGLRIQRSSDLSTESWSTVAARTGAGGWSGTASAIEETMPNGDKRVKIADPTPGERGFFRILTRSIGGGGP